MTKAYEFDGWQIGGMPALVRAGTDHAEVGLKKSPTDPTTSDDDFLWSNGWARDFWAGALTPLHFSIRAAEFDSNHREWRSVQGLSAAAALPLFKYRAGTAYINSEVEAEHLKTLMPPGWRAGMLGTTHPDERSAILAAPVDPLRTARAVIGMHVLRGGAGIRSWLTYARALLVERSAAELDGPSADALAALDDESLIAHAQVVSDYFAELNLTLWFGFYIYAPWAMNALAWMLGSWRRGGPDTGTVLNDLARGLPRPSALGRERQEIWELGRSIADSPTLRDAFEDGGEAGFLERLEASDEGREFLARYRTFLHEFGHLGSADRDLYHPRRSEDPGLVYGALRIVMRADLSRSPATLAAAQRETRRRTVAEATAQIAAGPFGGIRARLFGAVLGYVEDFWTLRDDQRHAAERVVMAKKRAWREIGRRLRERAALAEADDFYFLSAAENIALLRGRRPDLDDLGATVAARRADFERMLGGEVAVPMYLRGDQPEAEATAPEAAAAGTRLGATPLSGGLVVATARVVRNLGELDRLERDDVLIATSTDPGWSAAFLIAGGVIVEGGGALSFPGRMSREHEVPAVVLTNATKIVPDGARVELDADSGTVTVVRLP
jgi:phosphohistidine swiveling domain-containing protein